MSNMELVEANREKVMAWADEGKSYYWMGKQIGLGDRSANSAVSTWFVKQGIRRKVEE